MIVTFSNRLPLHRVTDNWHSLYVSLMSSFTFYGYCYCDYQKSLAFRECRVDTITIKYFSHLICHLIWDTYQIKKLSHIRKNVKSLDERILFKLFFENLWQTGFFKSNIYCVQISSNIEFKYTEKVKLFKE